VGAIIFQQLWLLLSSKTLFFVILLVYRILGAFKIFDISKANAVTRSDMRKVLRALYELHGKSLTDESDSPATRTDRVFDAIDTVS